MRSCAMPVGLREFGSKIGSKLAALVRGELACLRIISLRCRTLATV